MRQQTPRPLRPAIVAGGVLVLIGLAFLVFTQTPWAENLKGQKPSDGSKPGSPSIAWTPDHIEMDGNDTISVTLTAQNAIPATVLEFVPSLSPYLSVSPQSLPALAKGATQVVRTVANVPAGTAMDTIDGTLHVRLGSSTISRPLPITLDLWPVVNVEDDGITISYPPSWFRLTGLIFSNVRHFTPVTDSLISNESYFSVRVVQDANPSALPIGQWFHEEIEPSAEISGGVTGGTLKGFPFVRFVGVEGIGPYVHVLLSVGSDVIWITYPDYTPEFEDEYADMLSSMELSFSN